MELPPNLEHVNAVVINTVVNTYQGAIIVPDPGVNRRIRLWGATIMRDATVGAAAQVSWLVMNGNASKVFVGGAFDGYGSDQVVLPGGLAGDVAANRALVYRIQASVLVQMRLDIYYTVEAV
jgi:hypothetical protein